MEQNTAQRAFLALLTFIAFIVPLLLVDEVSLLSNWLYIFISWFIIILLAAFNTEVLKNKRQNNTDNSQKDLR